MIHQKEALTCTSHWSWLCRGTRPYLSQTGCVVSVIDTTDTADYALG